MFHEDWAIMVTSRFFTLHHPDLNSTKIFRVNLLTKFHEEQTIIVASRVLTSQNVDDGRRTTDDGRKINIPSDPSNGVSPVVKGRHMTAPLTSEPKNHSATYTGNDVIGRDGDTWSLLGTLGNTRFPNPSNGISPVVEGRHIAAPLTSELRINGATYTGHDVTGRNRDTWSLHGTLGDTRLPSFIAKLDHMAAPPTSEPRTIGAPFTENDFIGTDGDN
ncbi:hypothetical protein DPMN_143961 [Dreissena polymorpha]|uniref:Uncharacterized protein n=1 Tax=Dreissena polymorpha TaxID=45954 RepID=A0A9D4GEQ2_DREPO|nr:hypothetical protein DPMN_143961 [Dreissena polymorpha]